MGTYIRHGHDLVFEDSQVRIFHDHYTFPDGSDGLRTVVKRPAAVAAVCLNDHGEVALVNQWRGPIERYCLEIPAGKLDVEGEDAQAGILRELAEETLLYANRLEAMTTLDMSAGWCDERITIYLATDLSPAPRPEDFVLEAEEADMTCMWIPLREAVAKVVSGEITDAKTVVGLLLAQTRLAVSPIG